MSIFHRRSNSTRFLFLFLFLPLLLVIGGCSPSTTSVVREMTGTFSEQGSALVLELNYQTTDPEAPYFSPDSGSEWRLDFVRAGEDLGQQGLLTSLTGPLAESGALAYQVVSWHEAENVLAVTAYSEIWVWRAGSDDWTQFTVPRQALVEIFGEEGADGASVRDLSLSPDGRWLGTFLTFAFIGPGGVLDLRFTHGIAFWDTQSGEILRSVALLWPEETVDPALSPAAPIPYRFRMLWRPDSSGVVVLDAVRARFVSVQEDGPPIALTEVPERAVPSSMGAVRRDGSYVVAPADQPNEGEVSLAVAGGWIAFDELRQVALNEVDFTVPGEP